MSNPVKPAYKPKGLADLMKEVEGLQTPAPIQTAVESKKTPNTLDTPVDKSPTAQESPSNHSQANQSSIEIVELSIESLVPYQDRNGEPQSFDPYTEEEMTSLVESIKMVGIHTPIQVKPLPNGKYMILAGHNRTEGATRAELKTVPSIIKNVSDDVAEFIVLSTNLEQRTKHRPSVLATTCNRYIELARSLVPEISGSNAGDIVAEKLGFSRRQVYRYVQLLRLNQGLLGCVDSEIIPLTVASELTKLEDKEQSTLSGFLTEHEIKNVTAKHAVALSQSDFSEVALQEVFGLIKRTTPAPPAISVGKKSKKVIEEYFTGLGLTLSDEELAEKLEEILVCILAES